MHDNREFEQLFAACSNGELTKEERLRLQDLAGQDVGRRGALAEMEAVRELLDIESSMRKAVRRPADPAEEADEGYQRLASAAARAEAGLRASFEQSKVMETLAPSRGSVKRGPSKVWGVALATAAAVLVGILIGMGAGQSSGLDSSRPDDSKVLGLADIDVTTALSAESPRLSWAAPADAVRYDAVIVDEAGAVVLTRPATDLQVQRSTFWTLGAAEFSALREHKALFLEVIAKDKRGEEVARTLRKHRIDLR